MESLVIVIFQLAYLTFHDVMNGIDNYGTMMMSLPHFVTLKLTGRLHTLNASFMYGSKDEFMMSCTGESEHTQLHGSST